MAMKSLFAGGIVAAASAVGSPAAMAAVMITITDPGNTSSSGDPTTTFVLPATPSFVQAHSFIYYDETPAFIGGVASDLWGLTLFNANDLNAANVGGGLGDNHLFGLAGAQYYSGSESHPIFSPAVYANQLNYYNGNLDTVTISIVGSGSTPPAGGPGPSGPGAASGAPEPANWALMTLGVLALGAALRRRREAAAVPA